MGLIKIGKNTSIQDGTICHMTLGFSSTIIGNNVTIGHGVILHGCIIEDNCLIGMGSIILDEAYIGERSFVAAGSLITGKKTIEPESFMCGSPAKRLRSVNEREKAMCLASVQTYLDVQNYTDNFKTQASNFLMIITAFAPPKPKELDMAILTTPVRALLGI